jgi:hypothetical protein
VDFGASFGSQLPHMGFQLGFGRTVMFWPTKKDIFGNWIEHRMCEDYRLMNKWTHSNKYAMPLLKEIFDALG